MVNKKNKFKVGDIIIGNLDNHYGITCTGSLLRVIHVCNSQAIEVTLVELSPDTPRNFSHYIGSTFGVESKYFHLANKNRSYICYLRW